MAQGLAHLNAFEVDGRQIEVFKNNYCKNCSIHKEFLFDGNEHTLDLLPPCRTKVMEHRQ
jgi:hypothetical protein